MTVFDSQEKTRGLPAITAIIPTFRRPQLLARAIHSVLAQTFNNLQVIVLDNASGDTTEAVVAEIARKDPRVIYHCHASNVGALNNFQYGFKHVETAFFSVLSDDDILLPDFYATSMKSFSDHPEASFVACGVLHITPAGVYYGMPVASLPEGFYNPPDGLLAILRYGHAEWTGILFRRAIFDAIGFLNLETEHAADLDFELRAAARASFVVSHTPGAIFSTQPLTPLSNGTYPFDIVWPAWPLMIKNLTKDPHLSQEVKEEAHWRLENRFRDGLFSLGLRYLYQNKTADAQKVQDVLLHEYQRRFQGRLLKIALKGHQAFGPDRSHLWWSFCRKLWQGLKYLRTLTQGSPHGVSESIDVTPYLQYLAVPSSETLKPPQT